MIIFKVTPIAKPRMTQRDKWLKRDATSFYWAYKEELGYMAKKAGFVIGNIIDLIFIIPFKKNWNEEMQIKMNGKCHQEKPDIDNFIKGFFDALIVDDSKIWHISGKKYWGERGAIVILRNESKTARFTLTKSDFANYRKQYELIPF